MGVHNYWGDKIKEDEMGGACSTHRSDEKCIRDFGRKKPEGKGHSEDPGVGGKIILKWILGK
jgi:hypothetical protein